MAHEHSYFTICGNRKCGICQGLQPMDGDPILDHMPTDCPGRPLTEREFILIGRGELDFVAGHWISEGEAE
jgi:hypothetical protein